MTPELERAKRRRAKERKKIRKEIKRTTAFNDEQKRREKLFAERGWVYASPERLTVPRAPAKPLSPEERRTAIRKIKREQNIERVLERWSKYDP